MLYVVYQRLGKAEIRNDAGFVVTGGTSGCHNDIHR